MYPPNARLTRVLDAQAEPITAAQARRFLRLETTDEEDGEDELILDLITAARLECEQVADRSFIATTWKLTLDDLPLPANPFAGFRPALAYASLGCPSLRPGRDGSLTLPMPPLLGVTSFAYLDAGGVSRTLDPSKYVAVPGTPGRVAPAFGTFFPLTLPRIASVDITYTAGYGATAADVPRTIVQAIRMLAAFYYENRSADAPTPSAVRRLLEVTRWGGYA